MTALGAVGRPWVRHSCLAAMQALMYFCRIGSLVSHLRECDWPAAAGAGFSSPWQPVCIPAPCSSVVVWLLQHLLMYTAPVAVHIHPISGLHIVSMRQSPLIACAAGCSFLITHTAAQSVTLHSCNRLDLSDPQSLGNPSEPIQPVFQALLLTCTSCWRPLQHISAVRASVEPALQYK